MQQNRITRHQNTSHEHSMTIARSQRDRREMIIPEGTFTNVQGRKFSLPFRYLRTWFFSLLALIALPIGGMLLLIGNQMETGTPDWREMRATVVRIDAEGIRYDIENLRDENRGLFSFVPDDYLNAQAGGITLHLSACDLLSWIIVPREEGAQFTIWVNPDDSSQHSCVPISSDLAEIYTSIGIILLLFSAWRLVRTIHAAGLQSK